MSSLKPIARSVKQVTSKICQKKFISLGRVLDHWADIIGAEMADVAEPAAIKVKRQGRGKNQFFEKTLHIAVAPAHSMTLSYRKGIILERINRLLPREGIVDLHFVSSTRIIEKQTPKREKIMSEEEKNYLSSLLNDMEDDEIKQRLHSMGQSMFHRDD